MALILSSLYSPLNTETRVVTDVRNRHLLFLNQRVQTSKATHASFYVKKYNKPSSLIIITLQSSYFLLKNNFIVCKQYILNS